MEASPTNPKHANDEKPHEQHNQKQQRAHAEEHTHQSRNAFTTAEAEPHWIDMPEITEIPHATTSHSRRWAACALLSGGR